MHDLKYILEAFLLPPGILIACLILMGIYQVLRKRWLPGVLMGLLSLTAWAISTAPVSDFVLSRLESEYSIPDHPSGDVIVVLGAGINPWMPNIAGIGAPTQKTTYRLFTSARLQKIVKVPIIFSGAGNRPDTRPIKVIVIKVLKDMGVHEPDIMVEDQSRNTRENALNVARICKKEGFKKPILVSSAYHLKRSLYCFKKEGLNPTPYPAGFETWEGKQYTWRSYLPGNFKRFSIAVKEIMGLMIYRFMDHVRPER